MHFEPIFYRHLEEDRVTIYRLLGYLCPELAAELRNHDRVPDVLKRKPRSSGG
jgi:hypothetical protein